MRFLRYLESSASAVSLASVERYYCLAKNWIFLVEHSAPDLLILSVRDRHLDVMICLSITDRVFTITSSVVTHNVFGRLYMLPVGLVHKLLVNRDLERLKRETGAAET